MDCHGEHRFFSWIAWCTYPQFDNLVNVYKYKNQKNSASYFLLFRRRFYKPTVNTNNMLCASVQAPFDGNAITDLQKKFQKFLAAEVAQKMR